MSASPPIEITDEPLTTLTIFINEDSLATVACQLDLLACLIAQYGEYAFWGAPEAEPPRQTTWSEVPRSAVYPRSDTTQEHKEHMMRFLNISGPGVATAEECCPHCRVSLEDWDGDNVCRLCHFDTRQQTGQRRLRVRRR
jgi:hypothetical protein